MPQPSTILSTEQSDWISDWNFNDAKPGDWLKVPKNNKAVRKIWGHDRMPWMMYPDAPELFTYLPAQSILQITGSNKRIRSISWIPVSYNNQEGWLRKEHARTCSWRPTLHPSDLKVKETPVNTPFQYALSLENAKPGKMVRVIDRYGTIQMVETDKLPEPSYEARLQLLDERGKPFYAWLQQCFTDSKNTL